MRSNALKNLRNVLEEHGYSVPRGSGSLTFGLPTSTRTLLVSVKCRKVGHCVVVLMKARLDKVQFPTGNEETFEELLKSSDDQCLASFTYDAKDGFIYIVTKLISQDGFFPSEIVLTGISSIQRLAERYTGRRQIVVATRAT